MNSENFRIRIEDIELVGKIGNQKHEVVIGDEIFIMENLKSLAPGVFALKVNDRVVIFEMKAKENGLMDISVDGFAFETEVLNQAILFIRSFMQKDNVELRGQVKVKAPMPGLVVKVLASEGTPVQKGDKVVIIEAMKMENVLSSPISGVVQKIHVNEGQTVEKDATLVEIRSQ